MKKRRQPQRHLAPAKRSRVWRYLLTLACVLLLTGGGIAFWQWDSWFGQPEEPSYVTSSTIERVTLTPGADFSHQRTLSWRSGTTIRPAELLLSYLNERGKPQQRQLKPTAEVITTPGGRAVYYHVSLDSLATGVTYSYRIRVQGERDYQNSFTLPDEERRTSFFFLGDLQGNPQGLNERLFAFLRRSPLSADFYTLSGGILPIATDAAWQDFYRSLGRLSGSTPFILSPGMGYAPQTGWSSLIDSRWMAQLRYPANGPEGYLGRSYYIDFPLFRLIILDTSDLRGIGSIRSHRAWLKRTLQETRQPWRIVLSHHAVDRVEEGEKNLVMHYCFKDLLREGKADLILQGHDRSYARATERDEAGDTIPPLYIISAASALPSRNSFSPTFDRLGSGLLLYQHITIEPDRLSYASYRFPKDTTETLEKCRYDSVILRRPSPTEVQVQDLARQTPERFDYDRFSSDSHGRKRAAQYAKEVRDRAAKRGATKK